MLIFCQGPELSGESEVRYRIPKSDLLSGHLQSDQSLSVDRLANFNFPVGDHFDPTILKKYFKKARRAGRKENINKIPQNLTG